MADVIVDLAHGRKASGRFALVLAQALDAAGHRAHFVARRRLVATRYGRQIGSLPHVSLCACRPLRTRHAIHLFAEPRLADRFKRFRRRVRVDLRSSPWSCEREGRSIALPFPMHPDIYRQGLHRRAAALRKHPRRAGLLFAGNADASGYAQARQRTAKLSRSAVIGALEGHPAVHFARDPEDLGRRLEGPRRSAALVLDTASGRIPVPDWLATLAKADFFLAVPGAKDPLCHNAIEAMSVGTILVTNYPDCFRPALTDGVDCIAFEDRAGLLAALRRISTLDASAIRKLRQSVVAYFEANLCQERLLAALGIESDPRPPELREVGEDFAVRAQPA